MKVLGKALLFITLGHSAWVEWSVIAHAGIMWGLFFGMFFIPFAVSASLAVFPAKEVEE